MNYVLVDDEERALNLLRIMLTRFDGFSKENDHIYTFTQPVEALDFIRRTLVDVVFLDIEMPMLNGITLGKQISEELPAPPEIIYVTAFPEYSLDAWDIGAFGYILKPYDPKQISAVLNRVLKYHAAAAESITSAASIEGKAGFGTENHGHTPPDATVKCSQFPSCVDFTGFNCIQNCVYCYYLSFFSKIALKHRPHYFHI